MEFVSILDRNRGEQEQGAEEFLTQPLYFDDLNLTQIVDKIRSLRSDYDLKRYFYILLKDCDEIKYRQEILEDFFCENIFDGADEFSAGLYKARRYFEYAVKSESPVQAKRWKIDAAYSYINAVKSFAECMENSDVNSEGMRALKEYLINKVSDEAFIRFSEATRMLMEKMPAIEFTLEIERNSINVKAGRSKEDYMAKVRGLLSGAHSGEGADTDGTGKNVPVEINRYFASPLTGVLKLSRLEDKIIQVLQKEYPDIFAELEEYNLRYGNFFDGVLVRLEQEMQFYMAFVLFRRSLSEYDFPFCRPAVGKAGAAGFGLTEAYDLALALKNAPLAVPVVRNSVEYRGRERFLVVTGPNQGGKTTFARAVGQTVYFSMLGLNAPAASVSIPVFDGILTHFEVEESLDTGAGKLKEELNRLKPMMESESSRSFVVINELFTTAASYDAYIMGSHVLKHFIAADYYGIYVTHIKELAGESEQVASLVAGLDRRDNKTRTYKIERRQAEGTGHAGTLVDKYGLNYDEIKERLGR